jgi:hypothetical protein
MPALGMWGCRCLAVRWHWLMWWTWATAQQTAPTLGEMNPNIPAVTSVLQDFRFSKSYREARRVSWLRVPCRCRAGYSCKTSCVVFRGTFVPYAGGGVGQGSKVQRLVSAWNVSLCWPCVMFADAAAARTAACTAARTAGVRCVCAAPSCSRATTSSRLRLRRCWTATAGCTLAT